MPPEIVLLPTRYTDGVADATRCQCEGEGCHSLLYYSGRQVAVRVARGFVVPEHVSPRVRERLGGSLAMARAARVLRRGD